MAFSLFLNGQGDGFNAFVSNNCAYPMRKNSPIFFETSLDDT